MSSIEAYTGDFFESVVEQSNLLLTIIKEHKRQTDEHIDHDELVERYNPGKFLQYKGELFQYCAPQCVADLVCLGYVKIAGSKPISYGLTEKGMKYHTTPDKHILREEIKEFYGSRKWAVVFIKQSGEHEIKFVSKISDEIKELYSRRNVVSIFIARR